MGFEASGTVTGHTKRYSHVCRLEKQMDLILQSQNPIFSPQIRREKNRVLRGYCRYEGLKSIYIGPWALAKDVEWSEDI